MNSSVNASAMFPQLRLTPARAAFARPGPHATAFPDVNAPMQPSDSLVPLGRRSGRPSPAAYPGAEACSSPSHRCPRGPVQRRRHFYPGSPHAGSVPRRDKGIPGAWAILFVRAVVIEPAGCVPPLAHLSVRSLLPSGQTIPWAPGNIFLSWLPTHGPLARVPTLRRIRYRLRREARYRPGGLTLRRAGFAPAG